MQRVNDSAVHVTDLAVGKPMRIKFTPKNGEPWETNLLHTFNEGNCFPPGLILCLVIPNTSTGQIGWFKDGSALNSMAKKAKA